MLLIDELGTDGAQLDVHRSNSEAGAKYGLAGTCDSSQADVAEGRLRRPLVL